MSLARKNARPGTSSAHDTTGADASLATASTGSPLRRMDPDVVADSVIEGLGGFESLDDLYGADFSNGYHQLVAQYEQVWSRAATVVGKLPTVHALELQEITSGAEVLESALYDLLWTQLTGHKPAADPRAFDLYDRLDVAVSLLRVTTEQWEGVLALPMIESLEALGSGWLKILEGLRDKVDGLERASRALKDRIQDARDDVAESALQVILDLVVDSAVIAGLAAVNLSNPWLIAVCIAGSSSALNHLLGPETDDLATTLGHVEDVTVGVSAGMANDVKAAQAWRAGWVRISTTTNVFGAALDAHEVRTALRNLRAVEAEHAAFQRQYQSVMKAWEAGLPCLRATSRQLSLLHDAAARGRALIEAKQAEAAALRSRYGDDLFRVR